MKNWLLIIVTLLNLHSALGMELQSLTEVENSSLLYLPELRLLIIKFIPAPASSEETINSLKALALTNTKAYSFLKDQNATRAFLEILLECSYEETFDISLCSKLYPLLNEKEILPFNQTSFFEEIFSEYSELITIFKQCKKDSEWTPAFTKLAEAEKAGRMGYLTRCYSDEKFWGASGRETLLIFCLYNDTPNNNVPIEIIEKLILKGSKLRNLYGDTPPPCYIVCSNALFEKEDCALQYIKSRIAILTKHGASLNEETYRDISGEVTTPLGLAILFNQPKLMALLLKKGAHCTNDEFFRTTDNLSFPGETERRFSSTIKALITHSDFDYALSLFKSWLEVSNKSSNKTSEIVLSLFLENLDANDLEKSKIILDLAKIETKRLRNFHRRDLIKCYGALVKYEQKGAIFANKANDLTKSTSLISSLQSNLHAIYKEEAKYLGYKILPIPNSLKFIDSMKNLSIDQLETIPSVFHIGVRLLSTIKQTEPKHVYLAQCQKIGELFSWLAHRGIKDTCAPEGTTAAQLAIDLEMPEMARIITKVLQNTKG